MRFVIVGNGVAGINAANVLRSREPGAEITIISKESDHFFSRAALMYVFCGQMSARDVEPFERDHYKRMKFRRVRGEIVRLDTETRTLHLSDSTSVDYDRLLIACGSVPNMIGWPGQDLEGVGNFVTWQNLEWLQQKAPQAHRAVVVGGGLIGVEVAEILLKTGLEVSFVIREDWYWPIALDKTEGDMIVEHMQQHGCDVRLRTECSEVLGRDGHVVGLRTNHGETIACDLVMFTIGVRPQTDWLRNSGLELDKNGGVVVDEHLRTNTPDIYAAGDCTSVVWFNGVRRPEQLWYTSRDQGKVAGLNLAGAEQIYKRGTFYNSAKFFDLEYSTAGYVNFKFEGEKNWFQREPGTPFTQRITYLPDQTVIGFNLIGRRWDHRPLVRWAEEKRKLDWVLEHLVEANFDEEFMPEFKVMTVVGGTD
jgi:NADPH-dependent 2,4-dienoyl-CoA reductase/sulfur reductase-like enzyme